jgi:hypothetical protein
MAADCDHKKTESEATTRLKVLGHVVSRRKWLPEGGTPPDDRTTNTGPVRGSQDAPASRALRLGRTRLALLR